MLVDDAHSAQLAEHVVDDVQVPRCPQLRILVVDLESRLNLGQVVDDATSEGVFLAGDHPVQTRQSRNRGGAGESFAHMHDHQKRN